MGRKKSSILEPKPTRPHMPGYETMFDKKRGPLPWAWAAECLTNAHNYWLATTRPDRRPHVMPVWGIWLDNAFYFSTGNRSRKCRNLSASPSCVVCPEGASDAVILEGTAHKVRGSASLRRFVDSYKKKYDWDMSESKDPVFAIRPRIAFGFIEKPGTVKGNPTRWLFGGT